MKRLSNKPLKMRWTTLMTKRVNIGFGLPYSIFKQIRKVLKKSLRTESGTFASPLIGVFTVEIDEITSLKAFYDSLYRQSKINSGGVTQPVRPARRGGSAR